jgi:hypothetical protein
MFNVGGEFDAVPADDWNRNLPPVESWRSHFDAHELHTGRALLNVLSDYFDVLHTARVAYAFRYLISYARPNPLGFGLARRFLQTELDLIRSGAIVPLGLRAVARHRGCHDDSQVLPGT